MLLAVLTAAGGCASVGARNAAEPRESEETIAPGVALATFDTLWSVVERTYVDTTFVSGPWNTVRDSLRPRAMSLTRRGDLGRLLATTLAQIPDSHFYLIPANVADDMHSDSTSDDSAGGTTGLALRIAGNRALVWKVEPGSPAAIAGITTGQVAEQVGDRVVNTSLAKVLSLPDASRQRAFSDLNFKLNRQLTPAVGDTVRIRFAGTGNRGVIERQLVAVPMRGTVSKFGNLPPIAGVVRSSKIALVPASRGCAGTIAFNIWLPVLAPELQRAVDSVADCAGIVIDLRGNPGGVGAMVMGFGGFFVESPVSLGTMRMRALSLKFAINPRLVRVSGAQTGPFKGPVAILVDAMSASTSEIFATGMQRIGRAKVFGQRSAGAALPALMHALPSGDVFVHAVADFMDPAGGRIEGAGVIPDQLVPLTQDDLSHNIDAPLDAAVRWISLAAQDRAAASR
jgi:carboxyl-terminal processing protease